MEKYQREGGGDGTSYGKGGEWTWPTHYSNEIRSHFGVLYSPTILREVVKNKLQKKEDALAEKIGGNGALCQIALKGDGDFIFDMLESPAFKKYSTSGPPGLTRQTGL